MKFFLKRFAGRFALTLLPLFYQQWLRLREISGRLARVVGS
ncbi:MAG: hypothetical protein OXN92_06130 [Gammaproteobacteria bacterium]|nr:hypothetical protein [Gammaproteobacteria bacterium]